MATAGGQVAEREFALAHQALLDTRGLQFSFAAAPEVTPPTWLKPFLEILAAVAPVFQYVFWGGLILGALLLVYLLLGELLPYHLFRKKTSIAATDWRPEKTYWNTGATAARISRRGFSQAGGVTSGAAVKLNCRPRVSSRA